MKTRLTIGVVAAVVVLLLVLRGMEAQAQQGRGRPAAVAPSHCVIACYFHRTVRCPTCKKISDYIGKAIQAGFAQELEDGRVMMVMIDFQDPKYERYTNTFKITGPTLVLMDVHDGKVTSWKTAPKVWSFLGNKDQFFRYVQSEVQGYLEVERMAAR